MQATRELNEAYRIVRHYGPMVGAALVKDTMTLVSLGLWISGWALGIVALSGGYI